MCQSVSAHLPPPPHAPLATIALPVAHAQRAALHCLGATIVLSIVAVSQSVLAQPPVQVTNILTQIPNANPVRPATPIVYSVTLRRLELFNAILVPAHWSPRPGSRISHSV